MRLKIVAATVCGMVAFGISARAQGTPQAAAAAPPAPDPVRTLVERLDLEKYKATIKGLTAFGDRRQGTDRNRQAVDWIEAQLKSYGCTNTERIKYTYEPAPARGRGGNPPAAGGRGQGQTAPSAGGRG